MVLGSPSSRSSSERLPSAEAPERLIPPPPSSLLLEGSPLLLPLPPSLLLEASLLPPPPTEPCCTVTKVIEVCEAPVLEGGEGGECAKERGGRGGRVIIVKVETEVHSSWERRAAAPLRREWE